MFTVEEDAGSVYGLESLDGKDPRHASHCSAGLAPAFAVYGFSPETAKPRNDLVEVRQSGKSVALKGYSTVSRTYLPAEPVAR